MGGAGSSHPTIELPIGAAPGLAAIVEFHADHAAAPASSGDPSPSVAETHQLRAHIAACERTLLEGIVDAAQLCTATLEELAAAHDPLAPDPSSIVLIPVPTLAFHEQNTDEGAPVAEPGTPGSRAPSGEGAGESFAGSSVADGAAAPSASGGSPGASNGGVANGPLVGTGNRPPVYPPEARRKHQTGRVIVHVVVEADGSVSDASVLQSSGFDALDRAALDAVRDWHFTPASIDSAPIRSAADVPIEFVLREG